MKQITKRPNGTKRVVTINNEPTRTQQHHAKECNINNIMAKYKKTGTITHISNRAQGLYLDLTELPASYQEALMTVQRANQLFEQIPAETRLYFQNDPHKLISFLGDAKNKQKAIELGLVEKPAPPPVPEPPKV